jgi:hypothetical protein
VAGNWGKKEAAIVREMIYQENGYINHRVTWLSAFQALLFTALGLAVKEAKELVLVLALLGVGVSLSSWYSLHLADKAIQGLITEFNSNKCSSYNGPDVIGGNDRKWLFLFPGFALPPLFALSWVLVLVLSCHPALLLPAIGLIILCVILARKIPCIKDRIITLLSEFCPCKNQEKKAEQQPSQDGASV